MTWDGISVRSPPLILASVYSFVFDSVFGSLPLRPSLPVTVMNPRCGIKIQAYKKARKNKELDFQLPLLTEYLLMIEGIERRELEKRHAERTGKAVQDSKKSVPFDEEYDINRYDHQNWQKVLRDAHK